jgi:hypothetical protein
MVGALKHVGKMMHSPNHSRIGATTQKEQTKEEAPKLYHPEVGNG